MTLAAAAQSQRQIDLHLHSTASDGTSTPAEVVHAAHRAGLVALALTDHDTIDGLEPGRAVADAVGIQLVNGVELSAWEGGDELHLLGLHLANLEMVREAMMVFRAARRDRAEAMVRRLNELGVRITMGDVLSESGEGAIGRPHVARALVENGWAMDLRDAFDKYLGAGRPAYFDKRRILVGEAIDLVHRCGGLAVLAHPGAGGTRDRIAGLVAMGLDGVEVLHPSHSGEDRARLLALVEHFGLVPSGGSDSHGGTDASRVIGAMRVPVEWLELQQARSQLARRPAPGPAEETAR